MAREVPSALFTDLYELVMASAYVHEGIDDLEATFSLFVRDLPPSRGFLVAAGLDDVLTWLEAFRFQDADLALLARTGRFDDRFLSWLGEVRFTGRVRAVPEGTIVFAGEPMLEIDAPLGVAQLAETYVLNRVTFQTALATKCARCRLAAGGSAIVDFGMRRSHGTDAAAMLARCARIAGFAGTSNVEAAGSVGLPAVGTMAHSFVQAHVDEANAFRAFARVAGADTVLLVDTYDTAEGLAHAVRVAGELRASGVEISGVRIDSGDLAALSHSAREALDDGGFSGARVVVSGGLDEYEIERLVGSGAPIDGFGVGTAVAVSDDAPALDSAYKLVELDGRPVRKTSSGKRTMPGRKQVWRRDDFAGDVLALEGEHPPANDVVPLLAEVMRRGDRTPDGVADLDAAEARCADGLDRLPRPVARLRDPEPIEVVQSDGLAALDASLDRQP